MTTAGEVEIIAEAGVNHNGSLERAKQLAQAARDCGANVVKFQTWKTEAVMRRDAPKAEYQKAATDPGETQFEMEKKLELDRAAHEELIGHCRKVGIEFLSSPFDIESVYLLASGFGLPRLKLASGEITNLPLLYHAARTGKRLILSTGMSTLGEVETALGVLALGYSRPDEEPGSDAFHRALASQAGQDALRKRVVLLHCTTEYPAPVASVNLRAMDTLREAFGLPVGYSDHTPGIAVSVAAVARGAVLVEKHLTLDRNLPGPDHQASLEPPEFARLVESARQARLALGNGIKQPDPVELGNRVVARRSLVAARAIRKGELFSEENLAIKRPGVGLSPGAYWGLLGRPAKRDYQADEGLDPDAG